MFHVEHQLLIPALQDLVWQPLSQAGIALFHGPLESTPGLMELRFHVEHSPVDELTSISGTLFDEFVTVRSDQLQRQVLGQQSGALDPLSCHLDACLILLFFHSQSNLPTILSDLAKDNQGVLALGNDVTNIDRTEGSPHSQQIDGLQETGLSAGIGADKQIQPLDRIYLGIVDITYMFDVETGQTHTL